jgi:hypothetical protein
VTAVLVEVGRSCGGWACWELALAGSSRLLTCIDKQVLVKNFLKISFRAYTVSLSFIMA